MNDKLAEKLMSKRRTEILDGLYELNAIHDRQASSSEAAALLSLLKHRDADVREQAINVASTHWHIEESYPTLIAMLRGNERDQSVLTAACAAIGSMVAFFGLGNVEESSDALARIALDSDLDPVLRGTAYVSLLRITKKISVAEFAKLPDDIEVVAFDLDWTRAQVRPAK